MASGAVVVRCHLSDPVRGAATLLLAAALLGAGSSPATAAGSDDPTPAPTPAVALTPSLSPPSQQQIDDAKDALERLRNQGKTPAPLTQVAAPTADTGHDSGRGSIASRISDEAWWTIGAGLLVLLVASETTRISVKRAKHRKEA